MDEINSKTLMHKLDQILRVLGAIATKDLKQRDQISLLSKVGLPPREIAELLGTSANTVRVELVALRKAPGRRQKGRGKEAR